MSGIIEDVTEKDFDEKVLGSELPVVVDFWAPWCGPCRVVGPVLESIARKNEGFVKVVKINVDENPALASRFSVQGIPTTMLFDGGQVQQTLVGARPRADFEKMIQGAAGVIAS